MVIVEHPTEALAPPHWLRWCDDRGRPQESVFEALVVSLSVMVRHELRDRVLKRVLTEEDHSVQALGLYGAHEALRERIQIWGSWRKADEVDALTIERITKLG